jgi:hypothetical protein
MPEVPFKLLEDMSGDEGMDELAEMFLPRLRCGKLNSKSKSESKNESKSRNESKSKSNSESKGFAGLTGGRISHVAPLGLEGADSRRAQPNELGVRNWDL